MMDQGIELDPFVHHVVIGLDLSDQVRFELLDLRQLGPVQSLADDPGGAVGEFQHLQDRPDADGRIEVFNPGPSVSG